MSEENRHWYIAVEGVIGVGKTTLVRTLRKHFDSEILLEVFEENPFLSKFYADRTRYAFQTQMFFLLSRYRQQQLAIPELLQRGPLISDYMYAKDWLFAQLNLTGDEWEMYERIHTALAQQITPPDLIVYLQADTDILMGRIAHRDRPYERDMDRNYIDSLRLAYDEFLANYTDCPVLTIDTNHLNFVTTPADLQLVIERIRSVLREGTFQRQLPQLESASSGERWLARGRPLGDFQRFHVELDRRKHFHTDPYFNFMCLSEEIGELGSEYAKLWLQEDTLVSRGYGPIEARQVALDKQRQTLESELADCMAYLLKLANYADVDLEAAYLRKMQVNQARTWRDSPKVNGGEQ